MGLIATVYLGNAVLSFVTKTTLFDLIVDQKLNLVANELKQRKM